MILTKKNLKQFVLSREGKDKFRQIMRGIKDKLIAY